MSSTIENIKSVSNDNLSPSINFYSYVNQEWLDNPLNSIPDDYSSWGGFTKLHDDGLKNQINMVKILTSDKSNQLTNEQQKIAAIWNASSDRFTNWSRNESDYSPIVNEIKNLNKHLNNRISINHKSAHLNNLATYLHYSQKTGIGNVLDFDNLSGLLGTNKLTQSLGQITNISDSIQGFH